MRDVRVADLRAIMVLHESEMMVYLPLSTPLLRILFTASIIAYSFAGKTIINSTRLPLIMQSPGNGGKPHELLHFNPSKRYTRISIVLIWKMAGGELEYQLSNFCDNYQKNSVFVFFSLLRFSTLCSFSLTYKCVQYDKK